MFTPHHVSHITSHMLHVRCHVSHITFDMSFFPSPFFRQMVELFGGGSVINGAYPVQFKTHRKLFQTEESEDVGSFPAAPPSLPMVGKFCHPSKYKITVQVKNNFHPIPGPFCLPFCGSAPIMMLYV